MTKRTGRPMGRPSKYRKPKLATYRVSPAHEERVKVLKAALGLPSKSDVILEAVLVLHEQVCGARITGRQGWMGTPKPEVDATRMSPQLSTSRRLMSGGEPW